MKENKKMDRIIESNNRKMEEKKAINGGLRSLIPDEVQNMNKLLQNLSKITSYSWETDGDKVNYKKKLDFH